MKVILPEIQKCYLRDFIGERYKKWKRKKIVISAPTGSGKTTFVLEVLLPYYAEQGKKVLILCNRKLLRMQYWGELVCMYDCYKDLTECVDLMTYQEVASRIEHGALAEEIFYGYSAIVCDEAHYFYSDSDFNAYGTFVLLQDIIRVCIWKEIIFMSATADEVTPIIRQTVQNYVRHRELSSDDKFDPECMEIVVENFSYSEDFSQFKCIAVPDEDTLCNKLADSTGKTVIFVDNKDMADGLKKKILKSQKISSEQIVVLNADNINVRKNELFIQKMTIRHTLDCRILITTSVLDNGVSLHDTEIENLVIFTESKTSFLQMIGRVRRESVRSCKLYFLVREAEFFQKKENLYKIEKDRFEKLVGENLLKNERHYIQTVWDRDDEELADFYRMALVWVENERNFFTLPEKKYLCPVFKVKESFQINEFAKQKINNTYMTECKFKMLAISDLLKVIYEQMKWIGKTKEDLLIEDSTYREEQVQSIQRDLILVQNYTNCQLQECKREIVRKYHKQLFPDIDVNEGTISTTKLSEICERFNLFLKEDKDEERHKRYTIIRKNAE